MFNKHHRQRMTVMAVLLAAFGLLFATPAQAVDQPLTTDLEHAYLSKVIVGPEGTDASGDVFTFTFYGDGTIQEKADGKLYTTGGGHEIPQDSITLRKGGTVPAIGSEITEGEASGKGSGTCTLSGIKLVDGEGNFTNGSGASIRQGTVQISLKTVVKAKYFEHAGVYTYLVCETNATKTNDTYFVTNSKASFYLRVHVVNDATATQDGELKIAGVTVERVTDEDGDPDAEKVDAAYPEVNAGRITKTNATTVINPDNLAGEDSRGRNVPGFTFANEYVIGGTFRLTKITQGTYADRKKQFNVELSLVDQAAPEGSCVSYMVYKSDGTAIAPSADEQLDNAPAYDSNANHYKAVFGEDGKTTIKAKLSDGYYIEITGIYGFNDPDDSHREKFFNGMKKDVTFTVTESEVDGYNAALYVNPTKTVGEETKPAEASDLTWDSSTGAYAIQPTTQASNKVLNYTAKSTDSTYVYVMNTLADNKVTSTGIFMDNLPYVIMVGVPLAVLAVMFVRRRQANAAS